MTVVDHAALRSSRHRHEPNPSCCRVPQRCGRDLSLWPHSSLPSLLAWPRAFHQGRGEFDRMWKTLRQAPAERSRWIYAASRKKHNTITNPLTTGTFVTCGQPAQTQARRGNIYYAKCVYVLNRANEVRHNLRLANHLHRSIFVRFKRGTA